MPQEISKATTNSSPFQQGSRLRADAGPVSVKASVDPNGLTMCLSSSGLSLFVLQKRVCGGKEDTIRMRSDDQIRTINAYLRKRTLVKCVLYGIVS